MVFLLTTGDVLAQAQQSALESYVRGGGGWAGVHSAADTEYEWPFYGELVGAWFKRHPAPQPGTIHVVDPAHPSTRGLPSRWRRTEEWYDFRTQPRAHVLVTVDERTYSGGGMGAPHPLAWCHAVGAGRSWYTALGHGESAYREPLLVAHLTGGIRWAAGLIGQRCS